VKSLRIMFILMKLLLFTNFATLDPLQFVAGGSVITLPKALEDFSIGQRIFLLVSIHLNTEWIP
jgi:hypothetical protein